MTAGLEGAPSPAKRRGGGSAPLLLLAFAIAACVLLLIARHVLPPVAGLLAVAAILTAVFWQIRAHLPSILLVFTAVLLASVVATQRPPRIRPDRMESQETEQLARKWASSGNFDSRLPIVVHLIFDEMMSPGGMTDDLPGGAATRQALLDFGEKHSFRIFGSVYSRSYYTGESLPNLMNQEYLGRKEDSFGPVQFDTESKSYTVKDNAYFDDMARRGYRTAVFENRYVRFCANPNVDLCETFQSFDPGGKDLAGVDAPTQRVTLWQTVLRAYEPSYTSELGQRILGRVYGLSAHEVGVIGDGGRYDVHRFPEWFDRFTRFAATVPRGTHLFAHFLMPHSPYLLNENCVLRGRIDSGYELSQYPPSERAAKRRDYYERYLAQVRCVARKLDDFMTAVSRSDNYRDAVIIIHGDHGSRISSGDVVEDYGPRDYIDNYGAFFAVRSPAVPAGLDCQFVSLPEVFRRYAAGRAEDAAGRGAPLPVVVLSRAAGTNRIKVPMPVFGCAASSDGTAASP
jgi:hypothetical protein